MAEETAEQKDQREKNVLREQAAIKEKTRLRNSLSSLVAKLSAINSELAAIPARAEAAESAIRKTHTTSQGALRELKASTNASAMDSLQSAALTQPYISLWMQLVQVDANHPALNVIEQQLRQRSNADLSFLSQIRAAARRIQQQKMKAHGARGRTTMSGALTEGELGDLIGQYTGRG